MIYSGLRSHGESTRRAIPALGTVFHKGEWIEAKEGRMVAPHSFLLEQPPNTTLEAHFHRNNQFQVFVEGGGTIGRHALGPVVVHYAGAYTGYGPLVSGPQGLKYFKLRPVREDGYIPITERKVLRARRTCFPGQSDTPHLSAGSLSRTLRLKGSAIQKFMYLSLKAVMGFGPTRFAYRQARICSLLILKRVKGSLFLCW